MMLLHRIGIQDATILSSTASRIAIWSQHALRSSNRSFTYHIPHRISEPSQPAQHIHNNGSNRRSICSKSTARRPAQCRRASASTRHSKCTIASPKRQIIPYTTTTRSQATQRPIWPKASSILLCRQLHQSRLQQAENQSQDGQRQNRESHSNDTKKANDQSSSSENFYDRLHMPNFHRPTREELLAAATGFWSRLKVRFKWATIRSMRPYNMDEIVGFVSYIAFGHLLWLFIGTTTFISLAILAINTVFAQETLAGWVGNYLTKSSGLNVVFESAIVPKWGDGVITFKNVYVSRRPGQDAKSSVTKGSPEAAALASQQQEIPPEEQNYTQFDITLGEVNVTLSFNKWWNSKGLLQNVEVKHVRGVVDRTHVYWTDEVVDPKSFRHEHNPGDFEIENYKIEDLLITLHQPNNFRPFTVSIFHADLPRLRKQWMFYDFLCANSMTGEFDHSLFTIHPRQTHSFTGADMSDLDASEPWKKQSRIRIDALNIDHLNRGVEGPFGWITQGNVDIIADMLIPNDNDDSVMKVVSDFYDQIEAQFLVKKQHLAKLLETNNSGGEYEDLSPVPPPLPLNPAVPDSDRRYMVMDLRVHLNDVRAAVPIFTKDLSYVSNALIRPIVAYINSRRTFIPIHCRVVKRVSDFDGSWTIYDSGLMDDLSAETYDAFSRDVTDDQARMRRFKKVGLWSLQLAVQAIFLGMAGNIV